MGNTGLVVDDRSPLIHRTDNNYCEPLTQAASACWSSTGDAFRYAGRLGKAGLNFTGKGLYHSVDLFRISLVTQLYLGQFVYLYLVNLGHYGDEPPLDIQETWINWSLVGAAFLVACIAKIINQIKPFSESEIVELPKTTDFESRDVYKKAINYYSAQDYVYSLFSSSIVFLFFDAISPKGRVGNVGLPIFIGVTVVSAFLSLIFSVIALRDSTDHFTIKSPALAQAPKYPDASRMEKILNAITGASYGINIHALFWVFNREVYEQMGGMGWWQIAALAFHVALSAYAGYGLTSDTKSFHYALALSKGVRDGCFAYLGLSVIAIQTLAMQQDCVYSSCWQDSALEHMAKVIIPISVLIGLFSAATTLFRYDDRHESYEQKRDMVVEFPNKVKDACARVSSGIESGVTLFKKCVPTNCFAPSERAESQPTPAV